MNATLAHVNLRLFRRDIITWGSQNFRNFPWRKTNNPYDLLIAEVMLHRTRALQVVPVYEIFLKQFPTLESLCAAEYSELSQILYPLGLHWHTPLVRDMANILMSEFKGEIPCEKADLISLPGVSDYIASAVRCFAWNFPEALVDTNTVRITGRLFDLEVKDSSRRNPEFRKIIKTLVDPHYPRPYNYALLDLANALCTKS